MCVVCFTFFFSPVICNKTVHGKNMVPTSCNCKAEAETRAETLHLCWSPLKEICQKLKYLSSTWKSLYHPSLPVDAFAASGPSWKNNSDNLFCYRRSSTGSRGTGNMREKPILVLDWPTTLPWGCTRESNLKPSDTSNSWDKRDCMIFSAWRIFPWSVSTQQIPCSGHAQVEKVTVRMDRIQETPTIQFHHSCEKQYLQKKTQLEIPCCELPKHLFLIQIFL